MIKTALYSKVNNYNFEPLFKRKHYTYFTKGAYNLNIIGVRADNHNEITNLYDDILIVIYNTPAGKQTKVLYNITTEPGDYYMRKQLLNKNGTAILAPGQYKGCWQLGLHQGKYKALCQRKPVKVYRDNNRNKKYDYNSETIEYGIFGINIHRSSETIVNKTIDKYSAGCQVFNNNNDFKSFIRLCEKQKELYGNSFTYTLIDEKDLI